MSHMTLAGRRRSRFLPWCRLICGTTRTSCTSPIVPVAGRLQQPRLEPVSSGLFGDYALELIVGRIRKLQQASRFAFERLPGRRVPSNRLDEVAQRRMCKKFRHADLDTQQLTDVLRDTCELERVQTELEE